MHTIPRTGALAILAATGCVFGTHRAERSEPITLAVEAATELQLRSGNGSIEIRAGDADSITGTATLSATGSSPQQAQARLAELRLASRRDGPALILELDAPSWNNRGASFRLQVPPTLALKLDTSNGNVNVLDPFPSLAVDTSNGSVEASIRGGDALIDTSNGKILLAGEPQRLHLNTSNGDVRVRLAGDWSFGGLIDTSNGNIEFACPGAVGCSVSAETSNGRIRVLGGAVRMLDSPTGAVEPHLHLDTSNGSIEIRLADGR